MDESFTEKTLWEQEQAILTKVKEKNPELFIAQKQGGKDLLERIGITIPLLSKLPVGCLKYSPFDFIVEEIQTNGNVVTIDESKDHRAQLPSGTGTVYADLIKVGISTLDAIERIAETLHSDIKKIGYAGIKDAGALTAQRISIRGSTLDTVRSLTMPDIVLRNIEEGKGAITVGDLTGNRFTILVRTEDEIDTAQFQKQIEVINTNGILNFYGPQRFGSPRFISHKLGRLLWRGDFEGVVKLYLTEQSSFEWPYVASIRKTASASFGDWDKMSDTMKELPYTFRLEQILLKELTGNTSPNIYREALSKIPSQIKLWFYSYGSHLVNTLLSAIATSNIEVPKTIPLPLSRDKEVFHTYEPLLERDGTKNFIKHLRAFPFIYLGGKSTEIQTKVYPKIHLYNTVPGGIAISFDLPKGAYATTVLMFLFDLVSCSPITPKWLNADYYDTKELLETGSLAKLYKEFRDRVIDN